MTSNMDRMKAEGIVVILFVILCACIGVVNWSIDRLHVNYLIPVCMATVLLTFACWYLYFKKQISFFPIAVLIFGVLSLVSGVVTYAYDMVIGPLPLIDQMEFSRVIQPDKINLGLFQAVFGFFVLRNSLKKQTWDRALFFATIKSMVQNAIQDIHTIFDSKLFPVVFGIAFLFYGFFMIVTGLFGLE